ncbi:MAG: hypothetical protein ACQES2_10500 [Pseudomonadota bacterium]
MKKLLLASALIAATAPSMAEVSLSGGFVSDYYFRGGQLGDAGGYVGSEYSKSGFTAGVWAIQDGDTNDEPTIEYDVYGSYGFDVNEDVSLSIGYTQYNYNYTKAFESEVNLGAGLGPVAIDLALGEADDGADTTVDYTYASVSGDAGPIGLLLGSYDLDAPGDTGDYMHLEASAGKELGDTGVSLGVVLGYNSPKDDAVDATEYLFLDLSTGFDL